MAAPLFRMETAELLLEKQAGEIERLREVVRHLGELAYACTYRDLGEVCASCRCERQPPLRPR